MQLTEFIARFDPEGKWIPDPGRRARRALSMWQRLDFGEHWLWTGATTPAGYGIYNTLGNETGIYVVHRQLYTAMAEPVPPELDLDHTCRVRLCGWPEHCEPVTRRENLLRGTAVRETCPNGHPYAENRQANGKLNTRCRICHNEKQRALYRAQREMITGLTTA